MARQTRSVVVLVRPDDVVFRMTAVAGDPGKMLEQLQHKLATTRQPDESRVDNAQTCGAAGDHLVEESLRHPKLDSEANFTVAIGEISKKANSA